MSEDGGEIGPLPFGAFGGVVGDLGLDNALDPFVHRSVNHDVATGARPRVELVAVDDRP